MTKQKPQKTLTPPAHRQALEALRDKWRGELARMHNTRLSRLDVATEFVADIDALLAAPTELILREIADGDLSKALQDAARWVNENPVLAVESGLAASINILCARVLSNYAHRHPAAARDTAPEGAHVNAQRDYNDPANWATGAQPQALETQLADADAVIRAFLARLLERSLPGWWVSVALAAEQYEDAYPLGDRPTPGA